MTVSAVARLMPSPPARVDNRKQNAGDPTANSTQRHMSTADTHTFQHELSLEVQCPALEALKAPKRERNGDLVSPPQPTREFGEHCKLPSACQNLFVVHVGK